MDVFSVLTVLFHITALIVQLVQSSAVVKCSLGQYYDKGLEVCRPCHEICIVNSKRMEKCVKEWTCRELWPTVTPRGCNTSQDDDTKWIVSLVLFVLAGILFLAGLVLNIKYAYDKRRSQPGPSRATTMDSINRIKIENLPNVVGLDAAPADDLRIDDQLNPNHVVDVPETKTNDDEREGDDLLRQACRGAPENDDSAKYAGTAVGLEEHANLLDCPHQDS